MPVQKRVTTKRPRTRSVRRSADDRVVLENVNVPGRTTRVDAGMYATMRKAMLRVLPSKEPGLTQTEIREAVVRHLPSDLYPGGAKAGWWAKAVQLDLEAIGLVARERTTPLRWHKRRPK